MNRLNRGSSPDAQIAAIVRPFEGLREFREKLNDLHHEIQNRDDSPEAFEAMLWLAIDYLLPDFDPRYEVEIRRIS